MESEQESEGAFWALPDALTFGTLFQSCGSGRKGGWLQGKKARETEMGCLWGLLSLMVIRA